MFREMLKSKLYRAVVTDKSLAYTGSIAIDPKLLKAADMLPGEKVLCANVENGERFETYTLVGKPGEIAMNGAAARCGEVGDHIIIMTFAWLDEEELKTFKPTVIHCDEKNRIAKR